jgi:hypothetical protein
MSSRGRKGQGRDAKRKTAPGKRKVKKSLKNPENIVKKGLSTGVKYVILSGVRWISRNLIVANASKEGFNVKSGKSLKASGRRGRLPVFADPEAEEGLVFRSFLLP